MRLDNRFHTSITYDMVLIEALETHRSLQTHFRTQARRLPRHGWDHEPLKTATAEMPLAGFPQGRTLRHEPRPSFLAADLRVWR